MNKLKVADADGGRPVQIHSAPVSTEKAAIDTTDDAVSGETKQDVDATTSKRETQRTTRGTANTAQTGRATTNTAGTGRLERTLSDRCLRIVADTEPFVVASNRADMKNRGYWGNNIEYILSLIGCIVGLGNIWRFPTLAYANGGSAFILAYWAISVSIGAPAFLTEVFVGQFTSLGPTRCWSCVPLMQGLGYCVLFISGTVIIYYNCIVGWALYYLFVGLTSIGSDLPWTECNADLPEYNECNLPLGPCTEGTNQNNTTGTCDWKNLTASNNKLYGGIWNETMAKEHGIRSVAPAAQYFYFNALTMKTNSNLLNIGSLNWPMVGCLAASWLFVFVILSNGIHSAGKAAYVTIAIPYLGITLLFIRALTLDNGPQGMVEFLTPNFTALQEPNLWADAATQVFFSQGIGWGSVIALSSFNNFNQNVLCNCAIAVTADSVTSTIASLVVFGFLGHYAHKLNVPIHKVAEGGVGLVFVVYPMAMSEKGDHTGVVWAIIFFFTLLFIALSSSINITEGLAVGFFDTFPKLRKPLLRKLLSFGLFVFTFFLMGLPCVTNGGNFVLAYMDEYASSWQLLLVVGLECVTVGWLYGTKRMSKDLKLMNPRMGRISLKVISFMIRFFTPTVATVAAMYNFLNFKSPSERGIEFPVSMQVLGRCIAFVHITPLLYLGGREFLRKRRQIKGAKFMEVLKATIHPSDNWGPALLSNRAKIDYVPNFLVDPDIKDDLHFIIQQGETAAPKKYDKGADLRRYDKQSINTDLTSMRSLDLEGIKQKFKDDIKQVKQKQAAEASSRVDVTDNIENMQETRKLDTVEQSPVVSPEASTVPNVEESETIDEAAK